MARLSEAITLPVAYVADLAAMFNFYHEWPGIDPMGVCTLDGKKDDRIEVRVHGESWGDHRRYWRLFSVWIDGHPVAVGRHAGREGDDSCQRVILDRDLYARLAGIINSMVPPRMDGVEEMMLDPDIGDLTRWYGEYVKSGEVLRDIWSLRS